MSLPHIYDLDNHFLKTSLGIRDPDDISEAYDQYSKFLSKKNSSSVNTKYIDNYIDEEDNSDSVTKTINTIYQYCAKPPQDVDALSTFDLTDIEKSSPRKLLAQLQKLLDNLSIFALQKVIEYIDNLPSKHLVTATEQYQCIKGSFYFTIGNITSLMLLTESVKDPKVGLYLMALAHYQFGDKFKTFNLLTECQENPYAKMLLAHIHYSNQNYHAALHLYASVLETCPNRAGLCPIYIITCLQQINYSFEKELLPTVARHFKDSHIATNELSLLFVKVGDFDAAAEMFLLTQKTLESSIDMKISPNSFKCLTYLKEPLGNSADSDGGGHILSAF